MFLGRFKTYFSGNNRVLLPKKFRRELGRDDKIFLVEGFDGEIWGFSYTEWLKEAEKRLSIPLHESGGRKLRRNFFARSEECALDSQGRFIIPKELIGNAGIGEEVLIIGAGDHFELWDEVRFERAEKVD